MKTYLSLVKRDIVKWLLFLVCMLGVNVALIATQAWLGVRAAEQTGAAGVLPGVFFWANVLWEYIWPVVTAVFILRVYFKGERGGVGALLKKYGCALVLWAVLDWILNAWIAFGVMPDYAQIYMDSGSFSAGALFSLYFTALLPGLLLLVFAFGIMASAVWNVSFWKGFVPVARGAKWLFAGTCAYVWVLDGALRLFSSGQTDFLLRLCLLYLFPAYFVLGRLDKKRQSPWK